LSCVLPGSEQFYRIPGENTMQPNETQNRTALSIFLKTMIFDALACLKTKSLKKAILFRSLQKMFGLSAHNVSCELVQEKRCRFQISRFASTTD
jgi:D-alanyl-lipoteichoic acid acyltransferase DltB (MBOAT superfamily)